MSSLGTPRVHRRSIDSTNLRARELAAAGAPHGLLVTADEQTAGRGRQGRSWSAPPGSSLLASLLLRDVPELLSLRAGVAVAELAEAHDALGRAATIKWPNDVLLDGAKVAGILVEGRPQDGWAVLGVGLNVALSPGELPAELRGRAATLGRTRGEIERVLGDLLLALGRTLTVDASEVLAAVRTRDALRGRPVRWDGGQGTGDGIDDAGRLLVRGEAGWQRALNAGEVHLARDPVPRGR